MNFDFTGKSVIITGASMGIGRACAIKFAEQGANLALVDTDVDALGEVKAKLDGTNVKVLTYKCDISCEAEVKSVVESVISELGRVDVLVNNAGIWRNWTPFIETSSDMWKKYIDVNILGAMYFTQATLKSMLDNSYGRIINVASVAGVYGNANMAPYSMTKGALISFTKALAKEVTASGITVNAISPGSVSPTVDFDIDFVQDSELAFLGRTGSTAENADLICFLASDNAAYISGQNIQIDGCRKRM